MGPAALGQGLGDPRDLGAIGARLSEEAAVTPRRLGPP